MAAGRGRPICSIRGLRPGLADYAAAFAARYPWVRRYTPINEPLTTARFACLYGHWYPHRCDDRAFVAALLNQCCAIADAMTAIRGRVPDAQLVQTEDAGFVRAGRRLAAQARFENRRRWLSLDLLTGAVDEHHPLWRYLVAHDADRRQLARLHEAPVPPDVIGLNYYATSDRFLDERLDRYPPSMHGGNGRQRYADVDAVRVQGVGLRGHTAVLAESWRRYARPVAITEAHLGCTREEQMRWLAEAWHGAHAAAAQGADVQAVAAWALLGSWDWDSLLTRGDTNHYEAGAFDVRTGSPRPTALAGMIESLAAGRELSHPVLDSPGWWRRTDAAGQASARPLLITGANGRLGRAFARACDARGLHYVALAHRDLDITDPEAVREAIARWRPWAIVNGAGYAGVDKAEHEPAVCRRANAVGPAVLAAMCRKASIQLVTFSSDLVFDGQSTRPYVESDPVCPLNTYGRINVEAERRVLAFAPSALVIRAGALFGPFDGGDVISRALDTLAAGSTFSRDVPRGGVAHLRTGSGRTCAGPGDRRRGRNLARRERRRRELAGVCPDGRRGRTVESRGHPGRSHGGVSSSVQGARQRARRGAAAPGRLDPPIRARSNDGRHRSVRTAKGERSSAALIRLPSSFLLEREAYQQSHIGHAVRGRPHLEEHAVSSADASDEVEPALEVGIAEIEAVAVVVDR